MIKNPSYSRVFLTKASLGSIGNDLPPAKKNPLNLKIPTLQTSISRFSFKAHLNGNDYLLSPREASSTHEGGQSDRTHYQSHFYLSKTKSNFNSNTSRGYENSQGINKKMFSLTDTVRPITIDTEQDYTKETNLTKLTKTISNFTNRDDTVTFLTDGVRNHSSVKNAKNIIISFIEDLRSLRKPRKPISPRGSPNNFKGYNQATEQYAMIEEFDSTIRDLIDACDKAIQMRKSKSKIDSIMKQIIDIAFRNENSELGLYCSYVHGKVYMARNDFADAISHFRQYKETCMELQLYGNMLKAYKNLGKCCQELQKYGTALRYFIKFLQVAWYKKSSKHELLAYDYIGLQYYYMGQLEKATFYHSKMVSGKLETDNSNLKQIGIARITMSKGKDQISYAPNQSRRATMNSPPLKTRTNFGDHDDLDLSSKDDDFELPTPLAGQEDEDKYRTKEEERDKKKGRRVIVGLMKAKMAVITKEQAKEKQRKVNSGLVRKGSLPLNMPQRLQKLAELNIAPTKPSHLQNKPDEQIILSHLSRNRQLKNFSSRMVQYQYLLTHEEENIDWNDAIDLKSVDKIRKILQKFRINLLAVKQTLQTFHVGSVKDL